jgi:peptidoglycan/xylan/chitin deacetylase (PgdA/CDA1 family)
VSRRFRSLVLCFHGISDEWEHSLAVRPALLERVLRALRRRGYRPVRAGDVLGGSRSLLHVTFDDAYTNVWGAVPVLERLAVPATVFACAGFADTGRPLDVPELAAEASAHPEHLATMDWDELRELAERGVEIGAHTVSHPHLPRLSDDELARELGDSRARCEEELRRPCRFLAYPYGEADSRVHTAAQRAGFEAAFVLHGPSRPLNLYALPRVDLYRRDSFARSLLKTSPLREAAWAVLDRLDASRRPG